MFMILYLQRCIFLSCADSKMCKESFSMKIRLVYACKLELSSSKRWWWDPGREVPFGGKDAEVVEESCLASDPDQVLLQHSSGPTSCWCSRASAHILPGLPSICSAGCSPGPSSAAASAQSCPVARPARCPQVGKVGKPPSGEEHQDNGIPRFGLLWKHSFLSVSAGLSNEDKKKE